jgi:hypothetical protein
MDRNAADYDRYAAGPDIDDDGPEIELHYDIEDCVQQRPPFDTKTESGLLTLREWFLERDGIYSIGI